MRTLTAQLRDELLRQPSDTDRCRRAQLATMLRMTAQLRMRGGATNVVAVTGSAATARFLVRELACLHGVRATATLSGRREYEVRVTDRAAALAVAAGLTDRNGRETVGLAAALVGGSLSEIGAAWRGAVIAAGELRHRPTGALAVSCPTAEVGFALARLARRLGAAASVRETRRPGGDGFTVTVTEETGARELLARMGAGETAAWFNAERAHRRTDSNLVRANASRTAAAAGEMCVRVEKALALVADTALPPLVQAGKLRLEHPGASLAELGRRADPPVSKDTMTGRLRRLLEAADKAAAEAADVDGTETQTVSFHAPSRAGGELPAQVPVVVMVDSADGTDAPVPIYPNRSPSTSSVTASAAAAVGAGAAAEALAT